MNDDANNLSIRPVGPETRIEIRRRPGMGRVFLKALLISPFRSHTIVDPAAIRKIRMVFKSGPLNKPEIDDYRRVCGFSENSADVIPITYPQTLFIGLLGRFITSSFFPINPLGLIQTFQSFEQKRPIQLTENLNLTCLLSAFTIKENGIETQFLLEAHSDEEIVWTGTSIFFTRNRSGRSSSRKPQTDHFLPEKQIIAVPSETGRRYARVSGDYNPHHLHTFLAKPFGFKKAIAHGMWSLARVIADLDRELNLHQGPVHIQAGFKRPIFMPAVTSLGWETQRENTSRQTRVIFELRDQSTREPHLKGDVVLY